VYEIEMILIANNSSEGWLDLLNTNLLGTINITRSILPTFREKRGGKIVFVGSVDGWEGYAGGSAYSMSKFALEG
jgi:NAD(P)-dependent dehydrogenase (short-subunit alcohol dehydrogenase family)